MKKRGSVSPELASKVIARANRCCESCGVGVYVGEIHHIVGRSVEATEENLIYLCESCHRGENGCHGRDGAPLWLSMRLELQEKYYSQGKTEDEVRKLMGGMIYIEKEI